MSLLTGQRGMEYPSTRESLWQHAYMMSLSTYGTSILSSSV